MIMTLEARDKLMSLTDVSEMLSIPVHTLYRWRYALRHHYASVLLAAGESVVAVAERLGREKRRSCSRRTGI